MKKKSLKDLKVEQIISKYLVTEEKLYRFSLTGNIPVTILPQGSLIYTGQITTGPGGFPHAIFAIWEGREEIKKTKLVFIRQDKVLEKHKK